MRLSDFTYFVLCDVFKYICNLDSDTMPPRKKLKTITRAAQEADEQAAQEAAQQLAAQQLAAQQLAAQQEAAQQEAEQQAANALLDPTYDNKMNVNSFATLADEYSDSDPDDSVASEPDQYAQPVPVQSVHMETGATAKYSLVQPLDPEQYLKQGGDQREEEPLPTPYYTDEHLNVYSLWRKLLDIQPEMDYELSELNSKMELLQEAAEIGGGYIANMQKTQLNKNGVSRTGGLIDDEFRKTDTWGEIKLDSGMSDVDEEDEGGNMTFQSTKATPNGTLAASLREALNILRVFFKNKKNKYNEPVYDTTIEDIRRSTRDSFIPNEIAFANELIDNAINRILKEDPVTQQALLLQIFSPLMMKGLSDISQFGETVKILLLQIIEYKIDKIKNGDASSPNKYSDFSLPLIVGVTSDRIGAVLGVLIQQILGISALPRKNGRGQTLVFFAEYAFIALMESISQIGKMIYMNTGQHTGDPVEGFLHTFITQLCATNSGFVTYSRSHSTTYSKMCEDAIGKYDILLEKINALYQHISGTNPYASIDDKLDTIFADPDKFDVLKQHIRDSRIFTIPQTTSPRLHQVKDNDAALKTRIIDILAPYDILMASISDHVAANEDALTNAIKIWVDNKPTSDFVMPSWVGKLHTSVIYYNNCKTLFTSTPADLFAKYLAVGNAEHLAAVGDVIEGHDQRAVRAVKRLGNELVKLMFPGYIPGDDPTGEADEEAYCVKIMKAKRVLPFAQSAQADLAHSATPARATFTVHADPSFLTFGLTIPTQLLTKIQNDWVHVGGHVHCSVDFIMGQIGEIWWSKAVLNDGYYSLDELTALMEWGNNLVVGNIQSKYDQAAGTGCLTLQAGNRGISISSFTIQVKNTKGDIIKETSRHYFVYTQANDTFNDANTPHYRKLECAIKQGPPSVIFEEANNVREHYQRLEGNIIASNLLTLDNTLREYFASMDVEPSTTISTSTKVKKAATAIINKLRIEIAKDVALVKYIKSENCSQRIKDLRDSISKTNEKSSGIAMYSLFKDMIAMAHIALFKDMIAMAHIAIEYIDDFNDIDRRVISKYLTIANNVFRSSGTDSPIPSKQGGLVKTPSPKKKDAAGTGANIPTPVQDHSPNYEQFLRSLDTEIGGTLERKGYTAKSMVPTEQAYVEHYRGKELNTILVKYVIPSIVIEIMRRKYWTEAVRNYYSDALSADSLGRLYENCYTDSNSNVRRTVMCFISTIVSASGTVLEFDDVEIPDKTAVAPLGLGGASRRKRRTRAKKATKQRKITKRKCNIKHNKRRYTKHKRAKKAIKHTRKRKH